LSAGNTGKWKELVKEREIKGKRREKGFDGEVGERKRLRWMEGRKIFHRRRGT
jgi:hypothetical protein